MCTNILRWQRQDLALLSGAESSITQDPSTYDDYRHNTKYRINKGDWHCCNLLHLCKTQKSFAITTLFFLFFLPTQFSEGLPKGFLTNIFQFVTHEASDQDRTYFTRHTKHFFKMLFTMHVIHVTPCASPYSQYTAFTTSKTIQKIESQNQDERSHRRFNCSRLKKQTD